MRENSCKVYRIFLGILLLLVIGAAIWYGLLSEKDSSRLKDAVLVQMDDVGEETGAAL